MKPIKGFFIFIFFKVMFTKTLVSLSEKAITFSVVREVNHPVFKRSKNVNQ